jgi:oxygen-independent coproporphyrinogen-3 oxidase
VEFALFALRLNDGFSPELFSARTGLPYESIRVRVAAAQAGGLLEAEARRVRPTDLGRRFLNDLIQGFARQAGG